MNSIGFGIVLVTLATLGKLFSCAVFPEGGVGNRAEVAKFLRSAIHTFSGH